MQQQGRKLQLFARVPSAALSRYRPRSPAARRFAITHGEQRVSNVRRVISAYCEFGTA